MDKFVTSWLSFVIHPSLLFVERIEGSVLANLWLSEAWISLPMSGLMFGSWICFGCSLLIGVLFVCFWVACFNLTVIVFFPFLGYFLFFINYIFVFFVYIFVGMFVLIYNLREVICMLLYVCMIKFSFHRRNLSFSSLCCFCLSVNLLFYRHCLYSTLDFFSLAFLCFCFIFFSVTLYI